MPKTEFSISNQNVLAPKSSPSQYQAKPLASSLISIFLSHYTHNPLANRVCSTFKIYAESNQFLHLPLTARLVYATITSCLDCCNSLLTRIPAVALPIFSLLSKQQPWDLFKIEVHSYLCSTLNPQATSYFTQSEAQSPYRPQGPMQSGPPCLLWPRLTKLPLPYTSLPATIPQRHRHIPTSGPLLLLLTLPKMLFPQKST